MLLSVMDCFLVLGIPKHNKGLLLFMSTMNTDGVVKVMNPPKNILLHDDLLDVLMLSVLCSYNQSLPYSWSQPAMICKRIIKDTWLYCQPLTAVIIYWLAKLQIHSYTYVGSLIVEVKSWQREDLRLLWILFYNVTRLDAPFPWDDIEWDGQILKWKNESGGLWDAGWTQQSHA